MNRKKFKDDKCEHDTTLCYKSSLAPNTIRNLTSEQNSMKSNKSNFHHIFPLNQKHEILKPASFAVSM